MPINEKLLLYSLANTFHTTLGIDVCNDTKKFINVMEKKFAKLSVNEKIYYTKYSIQLAKSLMDYLKDITAFELNTDSKNEIVHDFRLVWKKKNIAHICMSHNSINVRDIIPNKLMKICKYKRNTKMYKTYTNKYNDLNDKGYQKIKKYNKYSELTEKNKNNTIIYPIRDLILSTLSKKRKCATNLFNYLFGEQDRIVFRLYRNRFTMYDFGKRIDNAESFRMKLNQDNDIIITFNNTTKFILTLQTNASKINKNLSIKFHTIFKNMDELFAVANEAI